MVEQMNQHDEEGQSAQHVSQVVQQVDPADAAGEPSAGTAVGDGSGIGSTWQATVNT